MEQYTRAAGHLAAYLGERSLCPELLLAWKGQLLESRSVATVNAMIAAVNGFLDFCGLPGLKLKSLRCQQRIFRETELAAVTAFQDREGNPTRPDILRALNRISSMLYIMMIEQKGKV